MTGGLLLFLKVQLGLFNPFEEEQWRDRIWRIGSQLKPKMAGKWISARLAEIHTVLVSVPAQVLSATTARPPLSDVT